MSDEIRINKVSQSVSPKQDIQTNESKEKIISTESNSKTPWLILGIVVFVLVVVGVIFRERLFSKKVEIIGKTENMKISGYQAVFLTNGQVYFGKMQNFAKDFLIIKDIYYLQVGPQQGSTSQPGQPDQQNQQSISLVKLGNELHGPLDEMHINRSHILFYEDLKDDGQVVKAIIQDKNTKK